MQKTTTKYTLSMGIFVLSAIAHTHVQEIKAKSTLTLNGQKTMVYFNDGDTFRVLDGDTKDSRARVAGINTLETYGPIHEWSQNTSTHLLSIANLATTLAQKGQWNCVTNNQKDIYGRILATCDDLSVALLKAGYAHAYSIDESSAKKLYLESQREAQKSQIGMWKYGTPSFIIVSLHSASEDEKEPYNRLISTKDGKSRKWYHHNIYGSCQKVCLEDDASCMIYVPFAQRYGANRPECLP